jgi:hypothetical protein
LTLLALTAHHSIQGRPRTYTLDVGRDLQCSLQPLIFLLVERAGLLGEDEAELAGRDVDPELVQQFPRRRLSDVLVVVLVDDETDQIGPEVAAGEDLGGKVATRVWPFGVCQRSRRSRMTRRWMIRS